MVLLAAIALAGVFPLALRRGLPPAVAAARLWGRVRPGLLAYVCSAPATFIYLSIVAITTWVLAGVTPDVAQSILHQHSSNLHELAAHPIKALVRSAFWSRSRPATHRGPSRRPSTSGSPTASPRSPEH